MAFANKSKEQIHPILDRNGKLDMRSFSYVQQTSACKGCIVS